MDAFELATHDLIRLVENIRLNPASPNFKDYAVGDANSEVHIYISRRHPGETTFTNTPNSESATETVAVTVRQLDDCLQTAPYTIKLNIEGAEIKIIRRTGSIIAESLELLLEFHPANIEAMNEYQTEIVDLPLDMAIPASFESRIGPTSWSPS